MATRVGGQHTVAASFYRLTDSALPSFERTLVDPATVSLQITDPLGASVTYTYVGASVSRASLGNYYKHVDCTSAGRWLAKWVTTGDGATVAPPYDWDVGA